VRQEGDRCKVFRSFPNFALKKIQFLERKQIFKNSENGNILLLLAKPLKI
jgi:hypothetical protein